MAPGAENRGGCGGVDRIRSAVDLLTRVKAMGSRRCNGPSSQRANGRTHSNVVVAQPEGYCLLRCRWDRDGASADSKVSQPAIDSAFPLRTLGSDSDASAIHFANVVSETQTP